MQNIVIHTYYLHKTHGNLHKTNDTDFRYVYDIIIDEDMVTNAMYIYIYIYHNIYIYIYTTIYIYI